MADESRGLSRGIGGGLEALLNSRPRPISSSARGDYLPIAAIQTGASQPRKSMQQQPLEELAASIKANGVIQPIVVRPVSSGEAGALGYEIVAGERRWQAAKLAGLTNIPVVIRDLSDQDAVAVALIENIQREALTQAEEARALRRLVGEFSLTHQQVADAVGKSRAAVTNLIRLLDLPAEVLALIDAKVISGGHGRALLGLEDDAERVRLGQLVAERSLSVRATENLVRKALKGDVSVPVKPAEFSVVSEYLLTKAARVELQQRASGKGKVVVEFGDADTRDKILEAVSKAVQD